MTRRLSLLPCDLPGRLRRNAVASGPTPRHGAKASVGLWAYVDTSATLLGWMLDCAS